MRQVGTALRALHRHLCTALRLRVVFECLLQEVEVADHDAQHVVEVVSDPARQPSHGLELACMQKVLLELFAFGDVEPHPEEFARPPFVVADHDDLIDKIPVDIVGTAPAIFQDERPFCIAHLELFQHALAVVRMDAREPEIVPFEEDLRLEPGDPFDALVREVELPMVLVQRGGIESDGQGPENDRLVLLAPTQGLFRLEHLAAHAQVLHEEPALLLALAADLLRLAVEVDEHLDLRLEDQRLDRLEHIVDRPRRIAAEDVQIVLVVGSQEDDRNARRSRPAADEACDFVAVDERHLNVEEDDGEILPQDVTQRGLARNGGDHLDARGPQHFLDSEEIALIVVDDEDLGRHDVESGEQVIARRPSGTASAAFRSSIMAEARPPPVR